MTYNRDDPRVKKTRRSLHAAFIRLLLQKGYDSNSIQDIATEAETARITFYRHYHDKEELLTDCLTVLYEELVEKTEQEILNGAVFHETPIRIFYEHLEEREQLYRILFSSRGAQPVVQQMMDYMARQVSKNLNSFANTPRPAIPNDVIAYHLVSALVGLGIWWLNHNKPYPVDYLIQVSMYLSLAGTLRSLGIEGLHIPAPEQPAPGSE